jgi:translation initiation factor 2B subunit (eIF-2B alpha/beta/delta family)
MKYKQNRDYSIIQIPVIDYPAEAEKIVEEIDGNKRVKKKLVKLFDLFKSPKREKKSLKILYNLVKKYKEEKIIDDLFDIVKSNQSSRPKYIRKIIKEIGKMRDKEEIFTYLNFQKNKGNKVVSYEDEVGKLLRKYVRNGVNMENVIEPIVTFFTLSFYTKEKKKFLKILNNSKTIECVKKYALIGENFVEKMLYILENTYLSENLKIEKDMIEELINLPDKNKEDLMEKLKEIEEKIGEEMSRMEKVKNEINNKKFKASLKAV